MKKCEAKSVAQLKVLPPYDFGLYPKLFIRGSQLFLPFRYSSTKWNRIIRLEDRLIVPVDVTCKGSLDEPVLHITFYRDISTKNRREIERLLAESFCTYLDLQPLYDAASTDACATALIERLKGLRPHLSIDPFESLIKVIVRQVVRAATAQKLIDCLVRRFGESTTMDGETYYCFPTPKALARARKLDLISCKIGYKWRIIRQVSRAVLTGNLDLEELGTLSSNKVVDILTEFNGIGAWTSRVFLYDGLHRLDCYPEFDISIQRAVRSLRTRWLQHPNGFGRKRLENEQWGAMVVYLFGSLWMGDLPRPYA